MLSYDPPAIFFEGNRLGSALCEDTFEWPLSGRVEMLDHVGPDSADEVNSAA